VEENRDVVMGIDPSSTRTGYALVVYPGRVATAGYVTGSRRNQLPLQRIAQMCLELRHLIEEEAPTEIVIEMSSGHVGARHLGGGAGLATYGMAVGAVWQACMRAAELIGSELNMVPENMWTGGISKSQRKTSLVLECEAYASVRGGDCGADVADAIGLAVWWMTNRAIARAAGMVK
jgi:Holliday junction resolvasome RuvABC endonuclease subunit